MIIKDRLVAWKCKSFACVMRSTKGDDTTEASLAGEECYQGAVAPMVKRMLEVAGMRRA